MLSAYKTPSSHLAKSIIQLSLQHIRAQSTKPHDPFAITIKTDNLGLPLDPPSVPLPSIPTVTLTRESLVKLHRLSALTPPPEHSVEEDVLKRELGDLIGLMEIVKNVELPSGKDLNSVTSDLLGQGVGQVVFDHHVAKVGDSPSSREESVERDGRELLKLSTRRLGDYYASKVKQ